MRKLTILIILVATAAVALSQEPPKAAVTLTPDNPFSAHNKLLYAGTKIVLLRSAEKVPEEYYSFKPTATVRTLSFPYNQAVAGLAEISLMLWLLVMGVNAERWKEQASAAEK